MKRLVLLLLFIAATLAALPARAHELRPAFLSFQETAPNSFAVLWKVPAAGDMRLGLYVHPLPGCQSQADPVSDIEGTAYLERWTLTCSQGLTGQTVQIDGLDATLTDVLARIAYLDGSIEIARLTPDHPQFQIRGRQGSLEVAATYVQLGVEHILTGYDHLLFVFALILLLRDLRSLLKAVTAFTVAHSITLAFASLGVFSLPQKPVEAAIALSIAFLARELVQPSSAGSGVIHERPWIMAFLFGLLHGFGFAGALKETGLPQTDVPLALFSFNLGVELGQLLFIALVMSVLAIMRATPLSRLPKLLPLTAYAIGTVSMFWVTVRIVGFWPSV